MLNAFLPIKTVSEANQTQEHWSAKHKRHKTQQRMIKLLLPKCDYPNPCRVTLTRCGGRSLDDDNLRSAFKWIRDQLADILVDCWDGPWKAPNLTAKRPKGVNDSDPRITWEYDQEKGKEPGIKINIEPRKNHGP